MIFALKNQMKFEKMFLYCLLKETSQILKSKKNIQEITCDKDDTFFIVGDLHGRFCELLYIFRNSGFPTNKRRYVFNGDYIDRGSWGFEIVILLCSIIVTKPNCIILNRGNHESFICSYNYGFQDELKHKNMNDLYIHFIEFFNSLPLATIVRFCSYSGSSNDFSMCHGRSPSIFIVHGGIPSIKMMIQGENDIKTSPSEIIDIINSIDRSREEYNEIISQLLWSDPSKTDECCVTKYRATSFSPLWTKEFCSHLCIDYIIRSHEIVDGHFISDLHENRVVTIFSCSFEKGGKMNKAEYIEFNGKTGIGEPHSWKYIEIPVQKVHPYPLYIYKMSE